MQRMVVRYLTKEEVSQIKSNLIAASLPTYGFDNKAKNYMQRDKYLSAAFGVTFIVVAIGLALYKPDPTKFQYTVFRTVLALAAAGFGAVVPGTIQVKVGKFVRAGGALALFVLVYFYAPAQLV
ncbi:hypothetical protein WL42_18410 [Burkholderia ubonensis]|nr:hypothetical protein WL42_18410 [Burkholderia ubonensis]